MASNSTARTPWEMPSRCSRVSGTPLPWSTKRGNKAPKASFTSLKIMLVTRSRCSGASGRGLRRSSKRAASINRTTGGWSRRNRPSSSVSTSSCGLSGRDTTGMYNGSLARTGTGRRPPNRDLNSPELECSFMSRRPFYLAGALLLPAAAAAQGFVDNPPLDFALHLERYDTTLSGGRDRIDLTVKRAGISAYGNDDRTLQPGLLLGYAMLDSGSASFCSSSQPEGFYVGPALRSEFFANRHLTASVTGSYLYQRVRDETGGRQQTLEWQQWRLALATHWRLKTRVALLAIGHYGAIEILQRLEGTVNQSRSLTRGPGAGGRAGLEFQVDGNGRIGVAAERGEFDGLDIYFQRQF